MRISVITYSVLLSCYCNCLREDSTNCARFRLKLLCLLTYSMSPIIPMYMYLYSYCKYYFGCAETQHCILLQLLIINNNYYYTSTSLITR